MVDVTFPLLSTMKYIVLPVFAVIASYSVWVPVQNFVPATTAPELLMTSVLPAPLVLLLGQDPLGTFLYGVEKQNLTDGSALRHSRMSCPAT